MSLYRPHLYSLRENKMLYILIFYMRGLLFEKLSKHNYFDGKYILFYIPIIKVIKYVSTFSFFWLWEGRKGSNLGLQSEVGPSLTGVAGKLSHSNSSETLRPEYHTRCELLGTSHVPSTLLGIFHIIFIFILFWK